MCVDVRVAGSLRESGHEATHLEEEGLRRMKDPGVFEKAIREDRIVITEDLGFGEIAAFAKGNRPSIVILRLENMRWEHVAERLGQVLPACEEDLARGAVVVIEEFRYRVRLLPIGGQSES